MIATNSGILAVANRWLIASLVVGLGVFHASADCTLTNIGLTPLSELGLTAYSGYEGGLYPNGANNRPPAHFAAGLMIATNQIQPLDAAGNVNTNTGKIVLLSVGMSNTTQEFASGSNDGGGTSFAFKARANADPSRNPRLIIVDGAQGGQDAPDWTNLTANTWTTVRTRRQNAGVTTQQVQAVWIKQSLQQITRYGAFPAHAQALERDLGIIVRNLRTLFPHLQLAYVSSRTRCYSTNASATNPEPYSRDVGFATKRLTAKQYG